jgi:DNA replication protein DnaC
LPRLFAALALARGDGRYAKLLRTLARVDLLILDDWGPERFNTADQRISAAISWKSSRTATTSTQ